MVVAISIADEVKADEVKADEVNANKLKIESLEDWLCNPLDGTEWVDGELLEKNGMTLKHGRTQSRLDYSWRSYILSNNLGGEVYTETPCRTIDRGRRPDIAYLTPDLLEQFGDFSVLPQSFPLVAEIISPTDFAEDVFAKASEYLQSGCLEVWLILPESQWILVMTQERRSLFTQGEIASSQIVLPGFSIAVNDLLGRTAHG
jgi:Uma2 family endonuclease